MRKRLDIKIGDVFERLTVIRPHKNIDTGSAWVCLCSCGVERAFRANYLMSGKSKSCGCFRDDSLRIRQRTHGETRKTREYKAWCNMKTRCANPNNKLYHRYGGRGIKVCDRWKGSYYNFLEDMVRAPSLKHSIDRINNDGNYEPGNCKWSTHLEQQQNKSLKEK